MNIVCQPIYNSHQPVENSFSIVVLVGNGIKTVKGVGGPMGAKNKKDRSIPTPPGQDQPDKFPCERESPAPQGDVRGDDWIVKPERRSELGRTDGRSCLAWLPIPLLLGAMLVLRAADLRTAYEAPHLLMAVDFLCRTLACLFIVSLAGRSFLARGNPGLLLLGCGVAIWGASGYVATSVLTHRDANLGVTVSNLGLWLAALCHLTGVVLSLRSRGTIRPAGLWLAVGYAAALGVVALITRWTFDHRLPVFFVEGRGGMPVRHLVLGSALALFALTAVLLGEDIPPDCHDKVFIIFQRLHTRRHYPGNGIGLAIVKRIIERHGRHIWVESQPGEGSTFYFTLPTCAAVSPS